MVEMRTAQDLPVGSDVRARGANWSKAAPDVWYADDGGWFNDGQIDGQIDVLLGLGGQVVFVPAGEA